MTTQTKENVRLFRLGRRIGLPANQAIHQARRWQAMFNSTEFITSKELPPTRFKK